jgi:hypothetical protein
MIKINKGFHTLTEALMEDLYAFTIKYYKSKRLIKC